MPAPLSPARRSPASPQDAAPDRIFSALGDPTRLGLFEHLCREGPATVAALTRQAGVSQPAVSKHLAILRRAALVLARPEGRTVIYAARPEGLRGVVHWTASMTRFWDTRLDALSQLLERMDE